MALSTTDRELIALTLPALGSLVAQPVFVLADTAIVGHLGADALAGLSLASNLVLTVVGLCVFLAFATTTTVARLAGAGRNSEAIRAGIDGMWLALGLGVVLAVAVYLLAPWATTAMGGSGAVAEQSIAYLRASAPGLPGMLVVLAATGALRGLKDLRAPLIVASIGAAVNAGLNFLLVYGAGLGIAGSGYGTAIVQLAMAGWLGALVVRGARAQNVSLRPAISGLRGAFADGAPLLLRTLWLRIALLLTVAVATRLGPVALAGHQIVNSIWGLAAFALDALAIAAQTLIGHAIGAGQEGQARVLLCRTLNWGLGAGAVLGLVMAGTSGWLAGLFTTTAAVQQAAMTALIVVGLTLPIGGYVWVLDGVLMGAGDGKFLALAGLITLVAYAPVALIVQALVTGRGVSDVPFGGLAWLWLAFAVVFMGARALAAGLRVRGSAWLSTTSE